MPEDRLGTAPTVRVPEPREDVRHWLADQFQTLRAERDRHRAPADERRRRAVLTIVRNESVFLPIWLGYYSRFFADDDIYVLDHGTSDASTDRGGFVRIPVAHDTIDHTWMLRTMQRHQHELMERYDAVLVTDVDEIVVPSPGFGNLGDYIDRFREPYVNCLGYELIHLVDREQPFDASRKVLDQRSHWFPNAIYDKPALATQPLEWVPGFHRTADLEMRTDPDLYLIHLHRMDYDICLERHRYRQNRAWNERDLDQGWARHNRITDEAAFARWFYEDTNSPFERLLVERMDPAWRGVL